MADNQKPVLVKIHKKMAKAKNIPVYFAGIAYIQTAKAFKIIGQGVHLKKQLGICSICGAELTNPNSIKLGIGPICAQHMGIKILTDYTDKDIAHEIQDIKIDSWFPKSCVEFIETDTRDFPDIQVPETKKTKETGTKKLEIKKEIINIYFPFDYSLLNKVKALSGRRYHKEPTPHWSCPNIETNQIALKTMGFDVPDIKEKIIKMPPIPGHLQKILFPFQKTGVEFLFQKTGRALIGDEMGCGKTIQALTYIEMHKEMNRILIICPASLKLNWAAEIRKWMTDYNLFILSGKKATGTNWRNGQIVKSETATKNITIINYDIMDAWAPLLKKAKMDIIVADEIHYLKNKDAKRTKACVSLGKESTGFIGLSGTPIINRPIEFYNALHLINPGLFNSFWNYTKRYCNAKKTRFGWDFSGSANTDELHEMVSNIMIRRLKKNVLKELPPKIRTMVPLEITNRPEYEVTEEQVLDELENKINTKIKEIRDNTKLKKKEKEDAILSAKRAKNAAAMLVIEKLKQVAVKGKMEASIKWIQDYLETEDKLVVFATHKSTLDILQNEFKSKCVRIDGGVASTKRQGIVNEFQNNPKIKIFLGNIQAAGVGITLTAAHATCFMEFDWTPGAHDQAEDRVHRIGQKHDSVSAYYLAAVDTIDQSIMELLDSKREVLDQVLDGKKTKHFSLIKTLLKKLRKDKSK